MRKYFLTIITLSLIIISSSCSDEDSSNTPRTDIELSEEQKNINHNLQLFAWKLFEKIYYSEKQNVLVSPISINYTIAMLQNGAIDETLNEIQTATNTNGYSLETLNKFHQYMSNSLSNVDEGANMYIENSLSHSPDVILEQNFTNISHTYFNSIITINNSTPFNISNRTGFERGWQTTFDQKKTNKYTFSRSDKPSIEVLFMENNINSTIFYETDVFSASSLNLGNSAYNMLFILPYEGKNISDVITWFKNNDLDKIQNKAGVNLHIYLPIFKLDNTLKIKDILKSMGINKLFSPSANLNKMTIANVYPSELLQRNYLKINEDGLKSNISSELYQSDSKRLYFVNQNNTIRTSTYNVNSYKTRSLPNRIFRLNRPFIYIIREISTGYPLFIGCIEDPSILQ